MIAAAETSWGVAAFASGGMTKDEIRMRNVQKRMAEVVLDSRKGAKPQRIEKNGLETLRFAPLREISV